MKTRWTTLLLLLVVVNGALFVLVPRYRYRSIVIHHSAGNVGDYASIREQHLGRGWGDAAYHLIVSNGSTTVPEGHLKATGRYRRASYSVATKSVWCNVTAIHVCVVGNYENQALPESMTPAVGNVIVSLQRRHRIADDAIELHRECGQTLCPGKHVDASAVAGWLLRADELDPGVRAQHRVVLASSSLVPWRISAPLGRAMGTVSLAVFLIWWRWPRRRRRRKASRARRERP